MSFLLSNPPYIESKVIDGLMPEVRDYEPRLALDGDADGLKFYRAIIENAESYLNEKGYILFEIGNHQAHDVQQLLVDKLFFQLQLCHFLRGLSLRVHLQNAYLQG